MKEGVDLLSSPYIFINPGSDYGHSLGNVLRQSASSTQTSTRWCWRPQVGFRDKTEATGVDSPLLQPLDNDLW